MSSPVLNELYQEFCHSTPWDGAVFFGLPVANNSPFWLAIDQSTFPVLLLPACITDSRPDINLRAVEVLFSRSCEIEREKAQPHKGCYTLIRLKENDPDTVRLFLKILEEIFLVPHPPNSNAEIATNIQRVAALFSRLEHTSRDLIGLWGEVYFISRARNIDESVQSWSNRKTAKYDFICDSFVLDVKTTLTASPKHRFSLEQLRPAGTFQAYIASLCVIEVPNGQTVGELIDSVLDQIGDQELRSRFLTQCLQKGGRDLYRSKLVLQIYPKVGSLAFFRAEDIPAPQINPDDPINNIRFDVDLSSLPALSTRESRALFALHV